MHEHGQDQSHDKVLNADFQRDLTCYLKKLSFYIVESLGRLQMNQITPLDVKLLNLEKYIRYLPGKSG